MNNENTSNPNLQKATTLFQQAGFIRLLTHMRQKYIELGQVGGIVILHDATDLERRDIASFLGKPPYPVDKPLRVKLIEFEYVLLHSFGCNLPALIAAAFPNSPLVTRQAQRDAHTTHQTQFHDALTNLATPLPPASRAHSWLQQGVHGTEWLYSRYKNASEEEQDRQLSLIQYIATILDQLPPFQQPERLALFAQRTSGDPHTLDPNRAAGRLFLLALNDLAGIATGTIAIPQSRSAELRLYTEAGLLVDTISSNVAVFNLAAAFDGTDTSDLLLQAAGKRVLLLPLRQLLAWERVLATTPDIYLFENPQVFEAVIATLDLSAPQPTLICTSGWPSVAATTLLDQLIAGSREVIFHYSGDFDLKGLQIAAHLLARYPDHCQPWHFAPSDYILALQSDGLPARPNDLALLNTLPAIFASLITTIQTHQKWAYQEGVSHQLAIDVRNS